MMPTVVFAKATTPPTTMTCSIMRRPGKPLKTVMAIVTRAVDTM
jgi:hypothetical protein